MIERVSKNRYQLPGGRNWAHEIDPKCARPVQDGVQPLKSHGIRNGYYIMYGTRIVSVLFRRTQLRLCFVGIGYSYTLMKTRTAAHSWFDPRTIDSLFYFSFRHLVQNQQIFKALWISYIVALIGLVTVFDAILTSRQTREKLQSLYENLMPNNFRRTAVLKKIWIVN